MATTYSTNLKLGESAVGDQNWGPIITANWNTLDALSPVGGLAVTAKEQPSTTLNVAVSGGQYVAQDGSVSTFVSVASQAITASSARVLYLDLTAAGALTVAASYPTTPHVRLATVVAGTGTIASVTDNRLAAQHSGQRIPSLTHLLSTATAIPTVAAGAAAGTSPTVTIAANSTDIAGIVNVTTGTSPGTGTLATVTFTVAFGAAPRSVQLTPANAATAAAVASVYAPAAGTTTFTLAAGSALTASTPFAWNYAVIG